jgi:hypothetical protein
LGAGFLTPPQSDVGKTKPELLAGALVWGPTPWLYVDGFYQRILQPAKVHVIGIAFSFGGNVGGQSSGVDAWGRVGLDIMGIYARADAADKTRSKDDVELRITPNMRAKILGSSVAKVGIGPRILGRDPKHPSVLASVALTYDADALIDQVLVTPAQPAQ